MRERWTITQATKFKSALILFDRVFAPPPVANELPRQIRELTFHLDLNPGGVWLKLAENAGKEPKHYVDNFLSTLIGNETYAPETSVAGMTFRALAGFCSGGPADVIPSYGSEEDFDRDFPRRNESIAYQAALEAIPVIDNSGIQWEQILEIRKDAEALRKLRDLRLWLEMGLKASSVAQAREVIEQKIDDYTWALKKHQLKTISGAVASVVDWKTPAAVGAAAAFTIAFAGPIAAALVSGLIIAGKIGASVVDRWIDARDAVNGPNREVAFLYDIQRRNP